MRHWSLHHTPMCGKYWVQFVQNEGDHGSDLCWFYLDRRQKSATPQKTELQNVSGDFWISRREKRVRCWVCPRADTGICSWLFKDEVIEIALWHGSRTDRLKSKSLPMVRHAVYYETVWKSKTNFEEKKLDEKSFDDT